MTTTDYAGAHAALERQERNADALAARYPLPRCPSWCALPAGHEWTSVGMDSLPDAVTLERHHEDRADDADGLAVVQVEQLHPDGAVTCGEPYVYLEHDADLDVEALRRLGARLMGAADRLACVRADVAAGL